MKKSLSLFALFLTNIIFATLPHAYVTDIGGNKVHVIDISNDTVQVIGGFTGPRVVKITPDGTQAFVGSTDNTVRVIDTITHFVQPTVIPINLPVALAITPDSQYVYVVSADNTVSSIQIGTLTVSAVISGFNDPHDIKISHDGTKAYVTNGSGGSVSVIDTATNTITDTITGFPGPIGIAINVDSTYAYVTNRDHNLVSVVDLSSNTISDVILGFNEPSFTAISPDKSKAFISNSGNDSIDIIRLSDNDIIGSFTIPNPKSIAVTEDGLFIYVGSRDGAVFKVSTFDYNILDVIPGFQNPSNIALTNNNAPQLTVNGCQTITSNNIFNTIDWHEPLAPVMPVSYSIYRNAQFTILAGTVSGSVTQFVDSNLEAGQTYSYYVVANFPSGFSNTYGSVSVTPARTCTP